MSLNARPLLSPSFLLAAVLSILSLPTHAQNASSAEKQASASDPVADDGTGELMRIVLDSDVDAARPFLARHPLANRVLPTGEPALLLAIRHASTPFVSLFLEAGADPNAKGPGGWTALFTAIAARRPDIVRLLLERGADATAKNEDGTSAIDLARAVGDLETILVLQEAMPNLLSEDERKTLYLAAAAEGQIDTVLSLLTIIGTIDIADERGWTSLMYATAGGHLELVSRLIQKRAAVNHAASNGVTALMVAATVGNRAIVDVLVSSGADKSMRNDQGQTAGAIALRNGFDDIAKSLGATPTAVSAHQRVAAAVARKDKDEVKRLLDSGAPAARPAGAAADSSALVVAACVGDVAILKLLLERGAKTDEKDAGGVTPLIASALCDQVEAARTLVAAKAPTEPKTKEGIDALAAAMARGNKDMVSVLAPSSNPTIETALRVLQANDLKTLAALVKANPQLGSEADSGGRVLLRHAILQGDPAVLEAVIAMTSYDVNSISVVTDKSALVYAIEANRPQAVRTLVKLGARPTQLLPGASPTTALDVASKRGASEALQIMSHGARKDILELQSVLFSLGFLKTTPDGAWGPGSQTAWDKLKEELKGRYSYLSDAVDLVKRAAAHYLRVCNQTGTRLYLSIVFDGKVEGWWSIENATCDWMYRKENVEAAVKVLVGSSPFIGGALMGATTTLCTKSNAMSDEREANAKPPCRPTYKETPFVEYSDFSKPFVARFR